MTKPFDPFGAIDIPDAHATYVRDRFTSIHRAHAERGNFRMLKVARTCKLDTGKKYDVTRDYRPISVPETVDMIQWWLLLDKLGFDTTGKEFEV